MCFRVFRDFRGKKYNFASLPNTLYLCPMKFWEEIDKELTNNHRVALLYVLTSQGSSPGRQGFKMLVSQSGLLFGSIGGGLMEHNMVELAKKQVHQPPVAPQIHRLIHRKNQVDSSGLICSGEQTVAIYVLVQKDKIWVESILQANGIGVLHLSEKGMQFTPNQDLTEKFTTQITPNKWLIQEDLGYRPTLHIIGGGHVSLALSKLATELDFKVYVYDDRPNINTFQNNPHAETVYISNYVDIARFIPQGMRHYIVIMSFMYDTDLLILRKLLPQKFKYLGMMGSQQKIKTLRHQLSKEGITSKSLSKLHAPIGIKISSQTPAEIAVSILGEMIRIKNHKN